MLGTRTLVVADPIDSTRPTSSHEAKIVVTPLDLIQALDDEDIERVVLLGSFARAFDIQHFLRETWPSIRVETAG